MANLARLVPPMVLLIGAIVLPEAAVFAVSSWRGDLSPCRITRCTWRASNNYIASRGGQHHCNRVAQ
jgi:hypothetical protein